MKRKKLSTVFKAPRRARWLKKGNQKLRENMVSIDVPCWHCKKPCTITFNRFQRLDDKRQPITICECGTKQEEWYTSGLISEYRSLVVRRQAKRATAVKK